MAKIILLEDRPEEASRKIAFLQSARHSVNWIRRASDDERTTSASEALLASTYDFLVLDIFLEDKFGGIHIYNRLIHSQLRKRWSHTLIWSMYTGPRVKEATYGEHEFPIRVFVETAGIPYENVFASHSGGAAPILQRIDELLSVPKDRCPVCGGELDEDESSSVLS